MNQRPRHRPVAKPVVGTALAVLLLAGSPLLAQAPTGNVFGSVTDSEGAGLPGATVTLTGMGAARSALTDQQGQFRFLGLDPADYRLTAELSGFGVVEFPNVDVRVNRNTTLQLVMQAAVAETVTVTSESPLLDERELQQGTTVTQIELEKIPTARDPWSILSQTPGVLVSSINVGGSESGQQASFTAGGTSSSENEWLLDGIQVTDMRASGATSTYYDFDQFAEVQMTSGGTEISKNTAGVSVHLVTKRGSNQFRGSARFYNTKSQGYFGGAMEQARPDVSQADMGPGQSLDDYGGREIREIEDLGFEAGGPVWRDRVWLWGSWAQNDIGIDLAGGGTDDTVLENTSVKLNAQITPSNSALASWNNGDKTVLGRGAGIGRPPETTVDQRGPSGIYRFEDSHVFSSSLFVTGTFSIVDGGFSLTAQGGVGPDAPESWRNASGVWQDNWISGSRSSPSNEFKVDGSHFFSTGSVNHELKVGGRYRQYEDTDTFVWPGRDIFTYNTTRAHFVGAKRGLGSPVETEYASLWVQDTITLGRMTLNAGLRFDRQTGRNLPTSVPANPLVPNVLPALDYEGADAPFDWTDLTPRVGFTYALGTDRETLIRASFAQFAQQLSTFNVLRTNPTGYAYAYFLPPYEDAPYTGTGEELDDPSKVVAAVNFDPANPTRLDSPNVTDPGLESELTTELLASVEHAFLPELVVGLTVTWRNLDRIHDERPRIRLPDGSERAITAADYVREGNIEGELLGGSISGGPGGPYSVPTFALRDEYAFTGGDLLINGSRERDYLGAALTFTKRLTRQWMLRGYFNYGQAEWDVPESYLQNNDPNRDRLGALDGELFVQGAGGRGARYLQSSWSANLNGLYQVAPTRSWGFNLSANVNAREGYVLPYFRFHTPSDRFTRDYLLVDDFDDYRLDDVFVTDLRIEKEFNLQGPMNLTFGIDAFNVTNESTEQSRAIDLSTANTYWLLDNISPRIYRLGVRLSWR